MEKGLLSLTRALKQVEKIQQGQPVIIQGPLNLLASVKKGLAPPEGIAQRLTVHKSYAYLSGVSDQMDVSEGPTKPTELQITVTLDMLALQQPYKPSSIPDAPAFTSKSKVKGVWFTDASAKHINGKWKYRAVALNIETGVEVIKKGLGSAWVGELKAVLLAVTENAKTVYVDSYAIWAGATQWLCQWEALDWRVNGKAVWQKEDWK